MNANYEPEMTRPDDWDEQAETVYVRDENGKSSILDVPDDEEVESGAGNH